MQGQRDATIKRAMGFILSGKRLNGYALFRSKLHVTLFVLLELAHDQPELEYVEFKDYLYC